MLVGGFGALFALIGGFIWYASSAPLWQCDEAIKATLKAPSTYRRISVDGPAGAYKIAYDAQNSFGVPLRGTGQCFIIDQRVSWYEDTTPNDVAP